MAMLALATATFGLCLIGLAYALWQTARLSTAATGLALLFGFGTTRQAFLLYEGSFPAWELGAPAFGEIALLGIALGGLAALRSLQRTTRERDRVEDLHWDSMEAVRMMSELAARPGADLGDKVNTMLQLGAVRFGLELGIAWCERSGDLEVLGVYAPDDDKRQALLAELRPKLRDVTRGMRAQVVMERDPEPRVFFGTRVPVGDQAHGVLAFAGPRDPEERLTATDKDLLGLMAQWLGTELERRARAAAPEAAPRRTHAPPLRPRRARDLNAVVRRAEAALRRRVGADATLELALDPELPKVRGGSLSLATVVESAVHAAAELTPSGRIRIETQVPEGNTGDLLLQVQANGDVAIDGLKRVYEAASGGDLPRGTVPFARLERLLRSDGGDVSVSVEPGERAVLTVYLPAAPRSARRSERTAAAQPSR